MGCEIEAIQKAIDIIGGASVAGARVPDSLHLDGYNARDFLNGTSATSPRDTLYYFRVKNLEAVRVGSFKYSIRKNIPELFDLENDPGENYNIIERHPEKAEEMQALLEKFASETNGVLPQ